MVENYTEKFSGLLKRLIKNNVTIEQTHKISFPRIKKEKPYETFAFMYEMHFLLRK